MDFTFSEEQQAIGDLAGQVLGDRSTHERLRELERSDGPRFDADLWAELLHALRLDPVPAFACALSADHDGLQWTFLKPAPEDLRRLYGLEVAEENVWRPVLDTVESGPARGLLFTVEVDSWWLPDTAGTAYRTEHVKTTITPVQVDRHARELRYLHNAGMFMLSGTDFDGIFGLAAESAQSLPPYIEVIRYFPHRAQPNALRDIVRGHLARRPSGNPIERLAASVTHAMSWLPAAGASRFHLWAFASLRQCGSSAELLADLAEHLDHEFAGAAAAAGPLRAVAAQFAFARHGLRERRQLPTDQAAGWLPWMTRQGLRDLAALRSSFADGSDGK